MDIQIKKHFDHSNFIKLNRFHKIITYSLKHLQKYFECFTSKPIAHGKF